MSHCELTLALFIVSLALRAHTATLFLQNSKVTWLVGMGTENWSYSSWIPVFQIRVKVKITQCWSSYHLRLSRQGKNVLISSFADKKNTGLCKLLAQTFCGMITKWELWFYFLYILQEVKWGSESHFMESVPWSRRLVQSSLCWGWKLKKNLDMINSNCSVQVHSSFQLIYHLSVILCWAPTALSSFKIKI